MNPATLLARAFHDDPYFQWAEPDAARRPRVLEAVFRGTLAHARSTGGHLNEPGVGSVDWRAAPAATMGWWQTLTSGLWRVALAAPPDVVSRLAAHEAEAMSFVTPHLGADTVYLCTLGVEPSLAGQGHGSRLLRRAFAEQATRWNQVVLRTEQPKNVPFYLRNGFSLVAERRTSVSGLEVWVFARDLNGAREASRPAAVAG